MFHSPAGFIARDCDIGVLISISKYIHEVILKITVVSIATDLRAATSAGVRLWNSLNVTSGN